MERQIGDIFEDQGVILEVVEQTGCDLCYYSKPPYCNTDREVTGECSINCRMDLKSVQFKPIKKIVGEKLNFKETSEECNLKQMPQYQCHKQVWALKIKKIQKREDGAIITPEEDGYGPFQASQNYLNKHQPQEGGYYVVYKDGYCSYSPAEAFEEGYSRI